MGICCCGSSDKVKYRYNNSDKTVNKKDLEALGKWGSGAIARRRFKKMIQIRTITNLRKPIYEDGNVKWTDDLMMTDEDIAYQMDPKTGGKGLYWNTFFVDIGEGRQYNGQWKNGRSTYGTINPMNDKKKVEWEGLGVIKYEDGSKYQGMTKDKQFNGQGKMTHANGDIFQGMWKDGKANGKGCFTDTKGSFYDGEWKDDEYHGQGTEQWGFNEFKYTGQFTEGKKTGRAMFEFQESWYQGDFYDGHFNGKGKYFNKETGDLYTGDFEDNNMNGRGDMVYANNDEYSGQFENGKRHGRGKLTDMRGNSYDGTWNQDEKVGKFVIFDGLMQQQRTVDIKDGQEFPIEEGATLNKSPWSSMRKSVKPAAAGVGAFGVASAFRNAKKAPVQAEFAQPKAKKQEIVEEQGPDPRYLDGFDLTNKYEWFAKRKRSLPMKIYFGVEFKTPGELLCLWSNNKKEWGQENPDALSMCLATTSTDHTFRTNLFGGKPRAVQEEPFIAEVGEPYSVKAIITSTKAKYWIDGEVYAECHYKKGDIPQKGNFGFGVYDTNEVKNIYNITIERYKPESNEYDTNESPPVTTDEEGIDDY